jgi:hypothetical protein
MKIRTLFAILAVLLGVAFFLSQAACTFDPQVRASRADNPADSPTAPPPPSEPPPPVPVAITATGAVAHTGNLIQYEDRSTTLPSGHCLEVRWAIRINEVSIVSSNTTDCGGMGSFGPLPPATYVVDQLAVADDGHTDRASYGPLTVVAF